MVDISINAFLTYDSTKANVYPWSVYQLQQGIGTWVNNIPAIIEHLEFSKCSIIPKAFLNFSSGFYTTCHVAGPSCRLQLRGPTLDTISLNVNTQPLSVAGSVLVTEPNDDPTTLQIKPFEDDATYELPLENDLPTRMGGEQARHATVEVDVPAQKTQFSLGSSWCVSPSVDINDVQVTEKQG